MFMALHVGAKCDREFHSPSNGERLRVLAERIQSRPARCCICTSMFPGKVVRQVRFSEHPSQNRFLCPGCIDFIGQLLFGVGRPPIAELVR